MEGFTRCSVSLMVWWCVTYDRVGELLIADGTLKSTSYIDILDHNRLDSVENMFGGCHDPIYIPTRQCTNAYKA